MSTPEKEIPVHHLTSEEFQMSTLSAAGPENFHDVHRHNFFEIIWFREVFENSRLELDFESYKLERKYQYERILGFRVLYIYVMRI